MKNVAVQVVGQSEDYTNSLKMSKVEVPKLGEGEVLVRVKLRPVHVWDHLLCSGHIPGIGDLLPLTLGSEGVGIVEENGPSASKFQKGERVVAAPFHEMLCNTWQNFVAVPESLLLAVPDSMDDKTAAQFYVNPVTVVTMLEVAAVPKDKYLLQSAANGVLGRMVIQYAKHIGIKTVSLVRRPEHVQELKDLGGDEVLDINDGCFVERTKEITGGEGAWASIDPVAGDFTAQVMRATRHGGTVLLFDGLSSGDLNLKVGDMLMGSYTVTAFNMSVWLETQGSERRQQILERTMQLLLDKVITPLSGAVYPLHKYQEAMEASMQPGRGGKFFLSSE